ncbi:MAG: phage tail sheath family protein [Proteobacteria bacterium]|nr:phage tail sheath family protein [Pseudomonadota bacterium]
MQPQPVPAAEADQGSAPAAIERLPTAVTAFIGRALKGPLNTPTPVGSFAEFQRLFGGLWQPSTLGYAIEQYFEHGGREALIVRVVNGARAPSLRLPAGRGQLLLRGRQPGTREYLRASVDYDGIADEATDQFNLVVQRLQQPGSELVEAQEIMRGVSITPGSERSVERLLARSRLVRLGGPLPLERPARTLPSRPGAVVGYVAAANDGADGADLTDYDLIGDATRGTGLFALRGGPRFSLLCVPPLSRSQDIGLTTLHVATQLCRAQQALLIVDPPSSWDSVAAALAGASHWAFQSEQALLYFPRLLAPDRLRGRNELFAGCGAAAGLIARGDEISPLWAAAAGETPVLRAPYRPQIVLDEVQRARLAQVGVNCFDHVRPAAGAVRSARTLLSENAARGEWRYLPARRLALWLQACVLEGTRWTRLRGGGPATWRAVCEQVGSFLESLAESGAFAGRDDSERFYVICDERLNGAADVAQGRCSLLFGFAAWRGGEFQSCLVTHEPGGSSVRAVTINRLATSGAKVSEEIETAILRQLASESGAAEGFASHGAPA